MKSIARLMLFYSLLPTAGAVLTLMLRHAGVSVCAMILLSLVFFGFALHQDEEQSKASPLCLIFWVALGVTTTTSLNFASGKINEVGTVLIQAVLIFIEMMLVGAYIEYEKIVLHDRLHYGIASALLAWSGLCALPQVYYLEPSSADAATATSRPWVILLTLTTFQFLFSLVFVSAAKFSTDPSAPEPPEDDDAS